MSDTEKAFNIENCEFAFKCLRYWEGLEPTDKDDKRYCIDCEREVFLVENKVLFEAHTRLGHCVAVHDPSRKIREFVLGMPYAKDYSVLKWD
ncbi:MAG: hypothetical protein HYX63_14815 [Gammaproteobacteria bacterium]|nr:hypothetical protein [Gammaproteobacteria bacterium]